MLLSGATFAPLAAEAQVGGALGAPHSAITAQSATPAPAGTPAQPAPPVRSRGWMPVIGTLAAGGLLGALFGGNALFGILMIALVVALGVYIARLILRTRGEDAAAAAQLAGLGSETVPAPPPSQATGSSAPAPPAQSVPRGPRLPEGFDLPGFLREAKLNFVRLQVASDVGRLEDIREFTTPQLYAALARGAVQRGAQAPHTDVVSLNAELTALLTEGEAQRASVRFNGMVRETPGAAPTGFAELWHFSRPVDGSTEWLLAGIRQVE